MDTLTTLKAILYLSLFLIVVSSLLAGLVYWIVVGMKKIAPNLKYWIKYKVFRKKLKESDVNALLQYQEAGMNEEGVMKLILLHPKNTRSVKDVRELLYVYSEIKKVKGGMKK